MKRNKVKVTKRNNLNSKQNRANICKITMAYITGTLNKGIGKILPPCSCTASRQGSGHVSTDPEAVYIVPCREIQHFTSYHGFISSMSCFTILCCS